MLTELIIVGAGGHAAVVASAARAAGYERIRVADQNPDCIGSDLLGIRVEDYEFCLSDGGFNRGCHIAIGDAVARERIGQQVTDAGGSLVTVVHPRAYCDAAATVGDGCFLAALSIVSARATVGRNCIINHGAIVDHDCVVASGSHIAPGAALGGGVAIGRSSLIGANAVVLPGTRIGDHCIVGAGSVVIEDVIDKSTVVGNPATELKP